MRIESAAFHWVHLADEEQWYFIGDGKTICVEMMHFIIPDPSRTAHFTGPRLLKSGALSNAAPVRLIGAVDDIPKNLWRKLKTGKVLTAQRVGPVVIP